MSSRGSRWLTIILLVLLAGCAVTPDDKAPAITATLPVALQRADASLDTYFNVGIQVFSHQPDPDNRISRIYEPILEAETNYLPVVLRNTLTESGFWGAVRVLPERDATAEVQVEARILDSTAMQLVLHVKVTDSREVTWIDRTYTGRADRSTYLQAETTRQDPFQSIYNQIANDMAAARQGLEDREVLDLSRAALLRYAHALAPEAFAGYLVKGSDGTLQVNGLPALDDSLYVRVKNIREAEYQFTERMDEHFVGFYQRLLGVYPYWQSYSYELLAYNQQIKAEGQSATEARFGWAATEDGYRTYKEYKMNEDELRELASSFQSEIHPTISRLEGQVIELSGPLANQYQEWRRLLRQLYEAERL